jgi:alpha-L-rhamnosidase
MLCRVLLCGVLTCALSAGAGEGALRVTRLTCEYKNEPLGIDVTQPRLSWVLESGARGQVQTAYQVLVAGTAQGLQAGTADLWDSGKVASDQSVQVVYAGKPLLSRAEAHWKVRVWEGAGRMSESAPTRFEMGLLRPEDWKAKWIERLPGAEAGLAPGCFWVWFEGNAAAGAPAGERFFRKAFDVAAGKKVGHAEFWISVDDKYVL